MSRPLARFTVAGLLAELAELAGEPDEPVGGTVPARELDELLGWFRSAATAAVAGCPAEARPLRLPKGRISDLLACERGTIARLGADHLSEAMVRGRICDLLVAQHLVDRLGADLEGDVRDGLAAQGAADVLGFLDEAGEEVRGRVWADAGLVADRLRSSWGPVERAWWPRVQERVSVPLADRSLVLAGQFDVALGGPPSGRPLVVIEVKAGAASDRHRHDLGWYGLLVALVHGTLPAVVATWTAADDGLVPVRVTVGVVEAAARRGLAALDRLVELATGRTPTETPHLGCRWCPDLDGCEPGLAQVASSPGDRAVEIGLTPTGPVGDAAGGHQPMEGEEWVEPEWDPGDDEAWA